MPAESGRANGEIPPRLTPTVSAMLREQMGPKATYLDMAKELNTNKQRIAQDLQKRYPNQFTSVDALQRHLGVVSEELRFQSRGEQDFDKLQKENPTIMQRIKSAITYPFRNPGKTAKFLLKTAIFTGISVVGLRLLAPFIEDALANVGFEKITEAFRAAYPSGRLATAPAPGMSPYSPDAAAFGGVDPI
jgi:hypothetical protein